MRTWLKNYHQTIGLNIKKLLANNFSAKTDTLASKIFHKKLSKN
jgi:hypothetical protein